MPDMAAANPVANLGMATRVLSILLLLAFGHAALVPPCDMHGEMHSAAVSHGAQQDAGDASASHQHHAQGSSTQGEHTDSHHESCTCLGDCHAPFAWRVTHVPVAEAQLALVVATEPGGVERRAEPVAWLNLPYALPFATAPPVVRG